MRVWIAGYVLLYLAVELLGAGLPAVDWTLVTPLMVASAVTDAMLVVSVLVAVLVAVDLARKRWWPALSRWLHAGDPPETGRWAGHGPANDDVVGVRSWRPSAVALPTPAPGATHAEPTYGVSGGPARPRRPFPEDDGTLL